MRNLPVKLIFYVFPIISILYRLVNIGGESTEINYDVFWIPAFAFSLFLIPKCRMNKRTMYVVLLLTLLLFLKYFVPYGYDSSMQLRPMIMDAKWVAYLAFALIWYRAFGLPDKTAIYKGGRFFSIIYILFFLFRYLVLKEDVSRAGILMEANYDGFMILMAWCFIDDLHRKKWENLIFFAATFCTLSRTGLAAMALMFVYKAVRTNILHLIWIIPILSAGFFAFLFLRGQDAEHMDRFVYWLQAYIYWQNTDISNILLGSTPGKSLDMRVLPEFAWTIDLFEDMRHLNGIYPFYFHSCILRIGLTWGIPVAIAYVVYFVYKFFNSKYIPLKFFCILTLIQSFSLSTLTLQNVSYLFFITLILMLSENRRKRSNHKKTIYHVAVSK